jgi:hypothetical protein
MLVWLVVSAVPVVLSKEGIPHALRSSLMIPAVFIIAFAGAKLAYQCCPRSPRCVTVAAATLILFGIVWQSWVLPAMYFSVVRGRALTRCTTSTRSAAKAVETRGSLAHF